MDTIRDEFLSEEDLDIGNLSQAELSRVWQEWLVQAQKTNEYDKNHYSHGVFTLYDEVDLDLAVPIRKLDRL